MPKINNSKQSGRMIVTPRTVNQFINIANEYFKYDLISYSKGSIIENTEDKTTTVKVLIACNQLTREFTLVDGLSFDEIERINKHNTIAKKKTSKDEAKKLINKSFNIGDILLLRGKYRDGSKKNEKYFEVKKVIWSLKGQIVNALILKQLSGTNNNMSLNKQDCIKYHVKYEPGLQVYSMNLDFKKRKINLNNLNLLLS